MNNMRICVDASHANRTRKFDLKNRFKSKRKVNTSLYKWRHIFHL